MKSSCRGLYNLVNHTEKMTTHERLSFAIRSAVLLKCLKMANFFLDNPNYLDSQASMTEDESYIVQLLFHFQTGIQYNLHGIYQVGEKACIFTSKWNMAARQKRAIVRN